MDRTAASKNTPKVGTMSQPQKDWPYRNGHQCVCVLYGTVVCENKDCDGIHDLCEFSKRHSGR